MRKKKTDDGRTVYYGFSDPEMHKALRSRRHTVIADKKKKASKNICRSRGRRNSADFFFCMIGNRSDLDIMVEYNCCKKGDHYVRNL